MIRMPAFVRLSLVLATLTASVVILGDFVGVVPDGDRSALDARAKLAESLAVQYSLLAQAGESAAVERSLEALVDRNTDVRWAALRMSDGTTLAETGHRSVVAAKGVDEEPESTATDVRVPIFRDNALWATVEIEFSRLDDGGILGVIDHPLLRMIIFFSVAGFLSYVLFLKRALKDLDPAAVIPDRVKAAMDALAEAVLFLDEKERIVLANKAFIDKLGLSEDALLGTAASQLPWFGPQGEDVRDSLPWARVLAHAGTRTGGTLTACDANDEVLTFSVNCTSIIDPRGIIRGALVTFDDLTELQRKNTDLQDALEMLEASQEQIKRQNSKLEFLATRDPLTGCLNRRSFLPRFTNAFDRAVEQGWDLSCVMVDIDHFKAVNDRYGHGIGDEVISLVGQMLSEAVGPDDFVCRYGGEEFCVVMLGKGPEDTRVICDRIRVSMPERTREEEALPASMTLTASFGLTSVSLGAGSIQEMLEQADKALYAAKDRGRNGVIGWGDEEARRPPDEVSIESAGLGDVAEPPSSEPSTDTAARVIDELEEGESEREFVAQGASDLPEANLFSLGKVEESDEVDLASDLRHALVREELRLCYQPTAELEEGKIVAMEALLRWDHPQLGLLQPGQFIGIAERAGLMESIGGWVLRETCRQAHSWHETGCRIERVSVNVSAAQLCSTKFREDVCAALEDSGLSPGGLELELNERSLSQNPEDCASSAEKLRGLGVRIAIDDFAKGTDALDYFPGFPADTVKVGRASVLDLRNGSGSIEKHGAIEKFGSIVTLARDFGVEVVAKGVETREQLEALRLLGCDRIQGYLLSPPVAPATASDLLTADRRLRLTASSDRHEQEGLAEAS